MSYVEQIARIAPLETFEALKLEAATKHEKELVGVILAFALYFNDLRDLVAAHRLLNGVMPPRPFEVSPEMGTHNALRNNLLRVLLGLLHELLELIRKNRGAFQTEDFRRVVEGLSNESRSAWISVRAAAEAEEGSAEDPLGMALRRIRNNATFHYAPKDLYAGFENGFLASPEDRVPFISRGEDLISSRFYFADAAAESVMHLRAAGSSAKELLRGDATLLKQITIALAQIVTRFIEIRGGTLRRWK